MVFGEPAQAVIRRTGTFVAVLVCAVSSAGAAADESLNTRVKVVSDWGFGSVSEIEILNASESPTADWRVELALDSKISEIWGAEVLSRDGAKVVLQAAPWNREIAPGGRITLGFRATPGGFIPDIRKSEAIPPAPDPPRKASDSGLLPRRDARTVPQWREDTRIPYAEALRLSLLFYEAQRSGRLPGSQRIWWRGDSALDDGEDAGVDLSGGYYDAGDHVKFAFPMAAAMTLLAWGGIEYPMGFHRANQWKYLLSTVRWGTDWLLKAQTGPEEMYVQVGEGAIDHLEWTPPERMRSLRRSFKIDAENPGSEVAGEAAAALAAASVLFFKSDPDYSARLLAGARALFAFANTRRGSTSHSMPDAGSHYLSANGFLDELAWAATWLFAATGEDTYLVQAESLYREATEGHHPAGAIFSWDDKRPGVAVLLARLIGSQSYASDAHLFLNSWVQGQDGIVHTPGGLAWSEGWGSLRYTANAAFLACVMADFVGDPHGQFEVFAKRQIDYMLGDNPSGRSYVVGFGPNPPRTPHHRAAHGSPSGSIDFPVENTHVISGALVGGPPTPDDFSFRDNRRDPRTNEVALDYNAAFTGALARMTEMYGKTRSAIPTKRHLQLPLNPKPVLDLKLDPHP